MLILFGNELKYRSNKIIHLRVRSSLSFLNTYFIIRLSAIFVCHCFYIHFLRGMRMTWHRSCALSLHMNVVYVGVCVCFVVCFGVGLGCLDVIVDFVVYSRCALSVYSSVYVCMRRCLGATICIRF